MASKKQDASTNDLHEESQDSVANQNTAAATEAQKAQHVEAEHKSDKQHAESKKDKKAEEAEAKIAELSSKLSEASHTIEQAADQYLRLRAEFENFRKRSNAEAQTARGKGIAAALEAFFPCMDSLDRAINICTDESQASGIGLIKKQFENALYTLGITEINPVGQPFNPDYHNAVMQEINPEKAGMVLEVLQKGYAYKDTLVRAAMVKVATEE